MSKNWQFKIIAQNENGARFRIRHHERLLSFKEVFELWQSDIEFIHFYINSLISFNFNYFYWEHPAVKIDFLDKNYECIVLKSNSFERRKIDEQAFADYIHNPSFVEVFENLGKNATLVVPTKKIYSEVYKNIGSFIRLAPMEQIQQQFQQVGETILNEILARKLIWLNTAGLGVIWLHIRLDTRPKYYKTMRYKNPELLLG